MAKSVRRNTPGMVELARRAGCWANALAAVALFFLLGALVSLFNGEIAITLQAFIAMFLLLAIAIWAGRRSARSATKERG
jgi:hypothetical protein